MAGEAGRGEGLGAGDGEGGAEAEWEWVVERFDLVEAPPVFVAVACGDKFTVAGTG